MKNQTLLKPSNMLSSLRLILVAASSALLVANNTKAEEITSPVQNPEQQASSEQQDGAGSKQPPEQQDDWKFTLGAGVMYMPAFVGSKDYQLIAMPNIKLEYKDRFFASPLETGFNIIDSEEWRAGLIMKFDFGRSEDDDNPFRIAGKKTSALRGMGDLDATPELGGFVEYKHEPFSYALELRQGVSGHEGLVGEMSVNYTGFTEQFGKPIMYAFGPRATFADSTYNNAYFGINSSQSTNSGLARYTADSGLVSYGISAFAVMHISDSISLGVFGGYDRLGSEAADSPLIKERGEENQFMGGIRLSYEFGY